jgi:hypothetical protein
MTQPKRFGKRQEEVIRIGEAVLGAYEEWTENPMGKAIHIPIQMPSINNTPPWAMTVICDCPWFIEAYFEDGERKFRHWTMREWFEKQEAK